MVRVMLLVSCAPATQPAAPTTASATAFCWLDVVALRAAACSVSAGEDTHEHRLPTP